MSEFEPSEQSNTAQENYAVFSNKYGLPIWVWQSLMGVTPQNRRAFQLQQQYLTPLTFEYVILTVFLRTAAYAGICALLWLFWHYIGHKHPLACLLIAVACISIYIGYQWSVLKNTVTVREEVIFNTFTNAIAWLFAVCIVFDGVIKLKSLLSQLGG